MTLRTFFDNFELLTDAPNAVATLRQIILQLAVRGKLVSQATDDEPASVLLERIRAYKKQIFETKKLQRTKQLPAIDAQKIAFNIPVNWELGRVGEIFDLIYGKSLPEKTRNNGHYPVYGSNGVVGYHDDFLTSKPSLIIGRKGSSGVINIANQPFWAIDTTYYVTPPEGIDLLFSYYLIKNLRLEDLDKSTAIPGLNRQDAYILPVAIPPTAEQKRIVERCDRLMSLCDQIEVRQQKRQESIVRMNESAIAQLLSSQNPDEFSQHWQRIYNNFDLLYSIPETIPKLRQAILQLAVQGKLVRQNPNDEPALVLVERLIAERDRLIAKKKINNYKPQPFVEEEGMPFELPQGWRCVRLGEITDIVSGVTKGRNLTGRKTALYPYLRVANVQRSFLDLEVMKEIEIPIEELEKYKLQFGDILLTEGGDWDKLGRSAVWQGQIQDCIHQNHVFRARPLNIGFLSAWAVMYTNSPVGRQYFEIAAKRTTNLASINMTQLRYCPFPVPPAEEQKRIVAKVDHLMSLCDTLETKLKEARSHSETLMEVAAKQILTA